MAFDRRPQAWPAGLPKSTVEIISRCFGLSNVEGNVTRSMDHALLMGLTTADRTRASLACRCPG